MWIFLYWVSRGVTEGLKWSDRKDYAHEYHLWRLAEVVFIFLVIAFFSNWWYFLGCNLIGIFVYERFLMKIASNKWFKEPGWEFKIGVTIKRYHYQDYTILIIGVILCLVSLLN